MSDHIYEEQETQPPTPPAADVFQPQAGIGVSLAVGTFGFSVLVLGLVNTGLVTSDAGGIFIPVAMATGAFGLGIGGLWEYRANNIFGGTFALFYSAFLLTTGLILQFFSGPISDVAGGGGFGDAFGMWLILWCIFTFMLSYGAWFINMPAFLAFFFLAIGYLVFGITNFHDGADVGLSKFGGWVLVVDGVCAWYLSWALAVNPLVSRPLPLWSYPYTKGRVA